MIDANLWTDWITFGCNSTGFTQTPTAHDRQVYLHIAAIQRHLSDLVLTATYGRTDRPIHRNNAVVRIVATTFRLAIKENRPKAVLVVCGVECLVSATTHEAKTAKRRAE
jgi:hypothetical protein